MRQEEEKSHLHTCWMKKLTHNVKVIRPIENFQTERKKANKIKCGRQEEKQNPLFVVSVKKKNVVVVVVEEDQGGVQYCNHVYC